MSDVVQITPEEYLVLQKVRFSPDWLVGHEEEVARLEHLGLMVRDGDGLKLTEDGEKRCRQQSAG